MKIIVSGGGTGGHIYPALAIIEEIKKRDPQGEILYIGTKKGLEADIVPKAGIPFVAIDVMGLQRKLSLKSMKSLLVLLKGLRQSKKIIRQFKPDLVIGTGGFVSFPIVYKAVKYGIPTLIHEQNSVAGISNRILGKSVQKIAITFPESERFFANKERIVQTGNPIRKDFFEKKQIQKEDDQIKEGRKVVLVFGGSNGHGELNEAMRSVIDHYSDTDVEIILGVGKRFYDAYMKSLGEVAKNIHIYPYLYDIISAYQMADLIVTSAGAITLAEVAACELPAILIPKAYTTENHQEHNARSIEKQKAAKVITEGELSGENLLKTIDELIHDDHKLEEMRQAAKKLAAPDAAVDIVDAAFSLFKKD